MMWKRPANAIRTSVRSILLCCWLFTAKNCSVSVWWQLHQNE